MLPSNALFTAYPLPLIFSSKLDLFWTTLVLLELGKAGDLSCANTLANFTKPLLKKTLTPGVSLKKFTAEINRA